MSKEGQQFSNLTYFIKPWWRKKIEKKKDNSQKP